MWDGSLGDYARARLKFASETGKAYFVRDGMSDQQPPSARDEGADVGAFSGPASVQQPPPESRESRARETMEMAPSTRPPPVSRPDPYVGKTFDGRYFIERLLGEGGMGIVYTARHKVIDKRVAIKVLRGEMAADHEVTQRFLQEAKAASAIGNAHIIDISDFGTLPDGAEYFVMELLDGRSLSDALEAQRPFPIPRLVHIAKQVAQGLSAAHAAGIVHRDLKPDNVMLIARGAERDFVKILDFGIAKVATEPSKITVQGSVFGTPHYMSPEQASGAAVDHRTDVYSFGVMLYEMASGKLPFDADNFMGILTQHMYKAPTPMRSLLPPVDVPAGLDAIVLKCMTKKPEGRYPSMAAVASDLEALERGAMPEAVNDLMQRSGGFNMPAEYFRASPSSMPQASVQAKERSAWAIYAGVAAAVAVIGIVVVVVVVTMGGREKVVTSTASAVAGEVVAAAGKGAASGVIAAASTPVSATRQVLVGVEPQDAKVSRDGADLGGAPIALELSEGEHAAITVARDGYKAQTVMLDGSQAKLVVKLVPAGAARAAPAPKAPTAPAAPRPKAETPSTSDLGDPWKK